MDNKTKGMFVWEPAFLPMGHPARVMLTQEEAHNAVVGEVGDAFRGLPVSTTWPQYDIRFVEFPGDLLIATLEAPTQ